MKIYFICGTCIHAQVEYADGEVEHVLLAVEHVRALLAPCLALPPPSAAELKSIAAAVAARAAAAGDGAKEELLLRSEAVAAASAASAAAESGREEPAAEAPSASTAGGAAAAVVDVGALTARDSPVPAGAGPAASPAGHPDLRSGQNSLTSCAQTSLPGKSVFGNSSIPAPGAESSGRMRGGGRDSNGSGSRARAGRFAAAAAAPDAAQYLPGEVVWCLVKGWCHWPALVMTHLHLDDQHAPGVFSLGPVPNSCPPSMKQDHPWDLTHYIHR